MTRAFSCLRGLVADPAAPARKVALPAVNMLARTHVLPDPASPCAAGSVGSRLVLEPKSDVASVAFVASRDAHWLKLRLAAGRRA